MTATSKQMAMDLHEIHRRELLVEARERASEIFERNGKKPITIEDVRRLITIPEYINPVFLGAVFNKKDWTPVGFVSATRSEAHGRPIRTFTRNW